MTPQENKPNQTTGEEEARKYATHIVSGPTPWEQFDNTKYKAFKAGWEARQGEAMEFAEWISDNQFTCYNEIWTSTKIRYLGEAYTTSQLFLTSKNK